MMKKTIVATLLLTIIFGCKEKNQEEAQTDGALKIVDEFYDATNNRKDVKATAMLITEDISFVGPLMQTSGAKEYLALLEKFLPSHVETRMVKQLEDGNDVCSIYDLVLKTPTGETITIPMVDWLQVSNGKVAKQRIYYDPREFAKAFGM